MKNRSLALVFSLFLFLFSLPTDLLGQTHCCCQGCGTSCVANSFGDCATSCFFNASCAVPPFTVSSVGCPGTACDPLPIELTFFRTETIDEDHILLIWETATETNNETFVIQRGSGTELNWETLGEIPGQGTTSFSTEYEFVDKSPYPGINYYRIKQIDFDGRESYSDAKAASISKILEVDIWPTLAKDLIRINFKEEIADQKIMIEIFDLMGRRVIEQELSKNAIDIRNLTKGHYFVNISVGYKMHTLRFVKVE